MKQKVKTSNGLIEVEVGSVYEEIPKEIRIMELKQKLADTDYAIIKIAEGSATAEEYSDVIEQRKSWREEINRLECELNDENT